MIKFLKNKNRSTGSRNNHLFKMNEPALTAKQHAAYERAIEIFTENLFSYSPAQRSKIYESVLKLLEIAIQSRNSISIKTNNKELKDPITQYLLLLKDTIKAAHSIVAHEIILFREEKQLSSLIGPDLSYQIRSSDEIFANSELNIYHCASDLIEMASHALIRLREKNKKAFSHEDHLRYKKTFKEYTKLYSSFGTATDEES